MENRQKIKFMILGILIGGIIGICFISSEKNKRAHDAVQFEKEKRWIIQHAKEREDTLLYTIDSLQAEIVYINASHALDTAQSLSDLGSVTAMLLKNKTWHTDRTGTMSLTYDIWNIVDQFHSDIRARLYKLGQVFFNSEARAISSTEDLEKFRKDIRSADRIIPIYQSNGYTDIKTYWEKINEFGKK